jgi:aspartyl-tRNA(Asn)/glutamyl-tRNA(Gln) amidotransferase subunit B
MIDKKVFDEYIPTIGIECHVQLRTKTKLFSGADNDARGKAPNTTVSPICFGLPGTLPVLNKEVVNLAIRAGVALNAEIAEISSFDRKHYFYPDLPKGYQITQLERPTVGVGKIEIPLNGKTFTVRINRAHIEEDAGKLTHPEGANYSLVDLNRAGTPLIEIVSEADMHSAAEAKAYVQELYLLMKFAGVTDGDLYHGNMRFDVNLSVAKKTDSEWGTRAEVKNLNSFRSVERAAEYEFKRQVEIVAAGGKIVQETRGWHDAKQKTFSQRSKENANDYRYFPDADLPPIVLTQKQISVIRAVVEPLLPGTLRTQLADYGIDKVVVDDMVLHDAQTSDGYIDRVMQVGKHQDKAAAKFTASFLINRLAALDEGDQKKKSLPTEAQFVVVHDMYKDGLLNSNNADQVLFAMCGQPKADPKAWAEQNGMVQENDTAAIEKVIAEVLADPLSKKAVEDIKAGNDKAAGFIVGQVMKRSQGKANPGIVKQLLKKLI